ncbi:hypothetical protein CH330_02420 [candidate division WOR-3 bacterium JGI_Cruoil_03_51_56]|uniref:FAD-binding FR-type domain-containing protein n=1 Tax=candidate division WOR-3 bacterium JGI_Cruoil_03_51_56 TaxID=1973747 RepID=A0A235BWL5_UNCW3|nr:MAG: hypothetical protein CH330_02420 [candidate division WOR-3 bacterium JGI_Cruoil_03_51_56]
MWIEQPILATHVKPGQFLNIKVSSEPDPLLRRPISVADVTGEKVRLVFRVVGRGTELLSRNRAGDIVDVLGPLGKPAMIFRNRDIIVCGGGVGAAPLLYLTRYLDKCSRVEVFLGARNRSQLILVADFRKLGIKPEIATDDGSMGWHGPVTEPVFRAVQKKKRPIVMACGPKPMLVDLVAKVDPVPVWGFVEQRMGCGVGICYCCGLRRKNGGYIRLCQEGPVVLLNEVEL